MSGLESFAEFVKSKRQNTYDESVFMKYHDILCVEYGWIPITEFRHIPIPTLFGMLHNILERKKEEARQMKKNQKPTRRK
jgi:hypothetical protein